MTINRNKPIYYSWVAPCSGLVTVNCDGAFSDQFSFGSVAFIVRDSWGNFIVGDVFSFSCLSPTFAKAHAILLVAKWAVAGHYC